MSGTNTLIELAADKDYDRLDTFLAERLCISRTKAQKLISSKNVRSNVKLKTSSKVTAGQRFTVKPVESPNLTELKAEDVAFDVIYEDPHLLVINKPAGLVVHPAPGNWEHTLVNGLVYRYPEIRNIGHRLRPGIVHRLDSPTSGLMIAARTEKVSFDLQKLFSERKVNKTYLAIAHNVPAKREGILSGPMDRDPDNFTRMVVIEGGKPALTGYRVLCGMNGHSLVECKLFTGRMHQIRVHMSALGCPLVGDTMYGAQNFGDEFTGRIYLHSWKLEFTHPATGERMSFRQTVPHDFRGMIARIRLGA
ncbi:MAG: RluA family pseudouridine synthase [Synergistaceae bacterium]|nr:RluA family pseudouridine synthase [Synergistaceae bacterium]